MKDKKRKRKLRRLCGAIAAGITAAGLLTVIFLRQYGGSGGMSYEEVTVEKKLLTTGVTEEGNVSVGTVEQNFALDFSRLLSESDSDGTDSGGGTSGAGITGSQTGFAAGSGQQALWSSGLLGFDGLTQQTASRQLKVEEVYVAAGEEVAAGTAILKFTDDSVNQIREELQEEVQNVQILYEKQEASWRRTKQAAESELELNQLYGTYASGAYTAQIASLQEALDDAKEEQEAMEETLAEQEAQLGTLQEQLVQQQEVLANAEYVVENSSREESLYGWLVALSSRTQAEDTVESLSGQIKTLEESMEETRSLSASAARDSRQKQEELASGTAEASATQQIRVIQADNAQEVYDVTLELAEFEKQNAWETYEEASARLSAFDSYIQEGKVYASSDGVVTEVGVKEGDSVSTEGTLLIGLNSYDDVTVTVTVEEAVMETARSGAKVNLTFAAFPEETFTGAVKEVGDAQIDSSTNSAVYEVTVSVDGGGSRFYEGMSAEVTFLTQEEQEALTVPRQAVLLKGEQSFVLVKTEGGNEKRQVTTGRRDGISVEITEGLQEGEIVLVEN